MPTMDHDGAQRELGHAECLQLVASVGIGRLAYTEAALPAVRPVSFTLHGEEVLVPARTRSGLVDAVRDAVVAFETDAFDPVRRTGWSVTAVGAARVLDDAPAACGRGTELPADFCFIVVRLTLLRGWSTAVDG